MLLQRVSHPETQSRQGCCESLSCFLRAMITGIFWLSSSDAPRACLHRARTQKDQQPLAAAGRPRQILAVVGGHLSGTQSGRRGSSTQVSGLPHLRGNGCCSRKNNLSSASTSMYQFTVGGRADGAAALAEDKTACHIHSCCYWFTTSKKLFW